MTCHNLKPERKDPPEMTVDLDDTRRRLVGIAAGLNRAGLPALTVADLYFEIATAAALSAVDPSELARVMRLRADDIEALGKGAAYDG